MRTWRARDRPPAANVRFPRLSRAPRRHGSNGVFSRRDWLGRRSRGGPRLRPITIEVLPKGLLALLDRGGTYGDPNAGDPTRTTNYGSSTTRARGRSSSTTAPSRLDVRAEAVCRLQGTATSDSNGARGSPT